VFSDIRDPQTNILYNKGSEKRVLALMVNDMDDGYRQYVDGACRAVNAARTASNRK